MTNAIKNSKIKVKKAININTTIIKIFTQTFMLPHQSANKLGFTIETVLQSDICSVELSVIGKAA